MMNKLTLKMKMIGAFVSVAVLLGVISIMAGHFTSKVAGRYSLVARNNVPDIINSSTMTMQTMKIARALGGLAIDLSADEFDPKLEDSIKAARKEYENAKAAYEKTNPVGEESKIFATMTKDYDLLAKPIDGLLSLAATRDKNNLTRFRELYRRDFLPPYLDLFANSGAMNKLQAEETAANVKAAEDIADSASWSINAVGLAGFILSVLLGWAFSARLGNSLAAIVSRIESSSAEVAAASSQIAQSSTELSESSTEQAAAIQETAASVDEVSAMIRKNSENAARSQTSSQGSRSSAEKGKAEVTRMVSSIGEISEANERIMMQVEAGNREISEIVKVIMEISNKTKVINDIVFQTKLLSFNASVEAARAGEHGKGFAVVAEEVGNLAQMSGNAAKEITDMLEASVKKVEKIVVGTKEGVARLIHDAKSKVDTGTSVARSCGEALEEILESVNSVNQLVGEIAHASREQATGIGEISKAMAQLDQATNQNSSVSQQCAASAEQLSNQTRDMNGLVLELNLLLGGAAGSRKDSGFSSPKPRMALAEKSAKVLPLVRPASAREQRSLKMASGSSMPAADDPRFEDV